MNIPTAEFKFRHKFDAGHRFSKSIDPYTFTPHGHTWLIETTLLGKTAELKNDMVADFSIIGNRWKTLLTEVMDHSFLLNIEDPLFSTFMKIPNIRVIPFPGDPTAELIAILLFNKILRFIEAEDMKDIFEPIQVLVQELETNSVCYKGEYTARVNFSENCSYNGYIGWWNNSDPTSRNIEKISGKYLKTTFGDKNQKENLNIEEDILQ